MLVALDPSINSAGVALFISDRLVWAKRVKCKHAAGADIAARCLAMARDVASHVRNRPETLVTEWSKVYRGGKGEGDPASLFGLPGVAIGVAALLSPEQVVSYLPSEWAGGLKKTKTGDCKTSPRAKRIESRLAGSELEVWAALKASDHDAIDSIGIGLHHLGRLKPRRVFSGAR